MNKVILFLTGTRADFGKLKSLINVCEKDESVEPVVFVTGMHMKKLYGNTLDEVMKCGYANIFPYINHDDIDHMDRTLAKTIDGLSHYIAENNVDMIVVHGDRVEALAGAIVGSLNNILVAHVEGGEVSGTIDELIRHAVSKMSHIHLVANEVARKRLVQLGEIKENIHVIGSPDIDLMASDALPDLDYVKNYYDINFESYAIAMYHPVTTERESAGVNAANFVSALRESNKNYVVIFPNNDVGSSKILSEYKKFDSDGRFAVFPSLRFEFFLVLLKNASFIIGNSSAAVREAPYYGVPTVNVGTRQLNRVSCQSIVNCGYAEGDILSAIDSVEEINRAGTDLNFSEFGVGQSDKKFLDLIKGERIWSIGTQKQLQEVGDA